MAQRIPGRHIFVSYRRQNPDLNFVKKLVDDLETRNHPVWVDMKGLGGSKLWLNEIQKALENCYAYLIVISSRSLASDWVQGELLYAKEHKQGYIFPVLFEQTELPFFLMTTQYIDFIKPDDYSKSLTHLIRALPAPPDIAPSIPPYLESVLAIDNVSIRKQGVDELNELAMTTGKRGSAAAEEVLTQLAENDPDDAIRKQALSYKQALDHIKAQPLPTTDKISDVELPTDDFAVLSALSTHPGKKKRINEDFVTFYEPGDVRELLRDGRIYVVADGAGGTGLGEKASQYATDTIMFEYYQDNARPPEDRLRRAITKASAGIYKYQHEHKTGAMATTVVAAAMRQGKLTIANVGLCRAYVLREGKIYQLTDDHSVANEKLKAGEINVDQWRELARRPRLTRSVGGEARVKIDIFEETIYSGDMILLCTDGLWRYTADEDLIALLGYRDPQQIVDKCIAFANQKGGSDNIGVAVIQVGIWEEDVSESLQSPAPQPRPAEPQQQITTPPVTPVELADTKKRFKRIPAWLIWIIVAIIVVLCLLAFINF